MSKIIKKIYNNPPFEPPAGYFRPEIVFFSPPGVLAEG